MLISKVDEQLENHVKKHIAKNVFAYRFDRFEHKTLSNLMNDYHFVGFVQLGFTAFSSDRAAEDVVDMLNYLFSMFEKNWTNKHFNFWAITVILGLQFDENVKETLKFHQNSFAKKMILY